MKLAVKLGKENIGDLEVSTIPGISHKFELNNKLYEILKVSDDTIEVSEVPKKNKISAIAELPGKPGEE